MSSHSQALLDQATEQLRHAQTALEAGQYGACHKTAYQASGTIAAFYMTRVDNAPASPSAETFQKFVDHIWDSGTTPAEEYDINDIVGIVIALREIHEWSILDEITKPEAELMLDRVREMFELVRRTLK